MTLENSKKKGAHYVHPIYPLQAILLDCAPCTFLAIVCSLQASFYPFISLCSTHSILWPEYPISAPVTSSDSSQSRPAESLPNLSTSCSPLYLSFYSILPASSNA